jgi:AcrR family transcriptional regulator
VEEIVRLGREILAGEGLEGLTMQRVARAAGVQAPSLYKHVRDRGDLIRLIGTDVVRELGERVQAAAATGDASRDVRAIADAFRAFAHEHPEEYRLIFARLPEDWRIDPELNAEASRELIKAVGELAGEDHRLEAARTVVAWAHGFVSMELAGAFRLGGDVDAAYRYGVERLTRAVTAEAGEVRTRRSRVAPRAVACTSDTTHRRMRRG